MRLDDGMVFLSDSRTNAGLDQISTFRKMAVFEQPGERVLVLLSAGNLAISQSVKALLATERIESDAGRTISIWTAESMFDCARIVGSALRKVHGWDGEALRDQGVEFNVSLILGGQVRGEEMRLFSIYSAGNLIEAGVDDVCYFQIGESKYGKPVIDRIITPSTPLDEATKCALVSMDSTIKSNLSVGLPLDLLVYAEGSLVADKLLTIDESNAYFRMIRTAWGQRVRQMFDALPSPTWEGGAPEHDLAGSA